VLTELERSGQSPVLDRSASIAGPDSDNNGVRDDIDLYIGSLTDTPQQKSALRQEARALGQALLAGSETTSPAALQDVSTQLLPRRPKNPRHPTRPRLPLHLDPLRLRDSGPQSHDDREIHGQYATEIQGL